LLNLEKQYQSVQEEVTDLRVKNKKLIEALTKSRKEIEDLNVEFQSEREYLQDTIRYTEKDLAFYLGIFKMLFSEKEMKIFQSIKADC